MRITSSHALVRCCLVAVLAALATASAQTEQTVTGTLAAVVDGAEVTLHTYATFVPEDAADGVTDERQRAILERVAGTEQHSATFTVMEETKLGSMVISPATVYVSVYARDESAGAASRAAVEVTFSLAPDTLELGPEEDVQVKYLPDGTSLDGYYALTEGALEIGSVEVVDATTLAITGSFAGLLSWQEGHEVVHDPADVLSVAATFELRRVVASGDALEIVSGD